MYKPWLGMPPPKDPSEIGAFRDGYGPPIDGLDRLRAVLKTLTEEEWCELARQMYPVGTPPPRLFSRAALAAWMKTWMHRS